MAFGNTGGGFQNAFFSKCTQFADFTVLLLAVSASDGRRTSTRLTLRRRHSDSPSHSRRPIYDRNQRQIGTVTIERGELPREVGSISMIRLRLALNLFSCRLLTNRVSFPSTTVASFLARYIQSGNCRIIEDQHFPVALPVSDVLTIPPSQRLVNWRSATPWGKIPRL